MTELRLLGTLELLDDRGARMDEAMRRPKVVAVLGYLAAARPRGPHRREKVAALFWPELPADRARAALRVTLTRLRDDLGGDVILSQGANEIAVDRGRLQCDVVALDDALARGDVAEAAALYRGPLLDGLHVDGAGEELEQWVSAERRRVREALTSQLVRAATERELSRDFSDAVTLATRAVEISPDHEPAHRALIRARIATGDHAGALRLFEQLRANLARDFDVTPAAETLSLVAPLRSNGSAVLDPPTGPPPGRGFVPGGLGGEKRPLWLGNASILGVAIALAAIVLLALLPRARAASSEARDVGIARWRMVKAVSGPHPRGRIEPAAILDSTGSVVLFGGNAYIESPDSSHLLNDLWRLRGLRDGETPVWTRMRAIGAAPAPRWLFAMAGDVAHDRVVLQGGALGFTSPCADDTWILTHASGVGSAPAWRRVRIHGPTGPRRAGMRVAFDTATRRLILFGGHDCIATFFSDVWVLAFDDSSLTSGRWTQLQPDSSAGAPPARSAYGEAYDAESNRLLVHGGATNAVTYADLWVLEYANGLGGRSAWRPMRCAGSAPSRSSITMFLDDARSVLTMFGGIDSVKDFHHDLWRVTGVNGASGCRWEQIQSQEPFPNARGGAIAMSAEPGRAVLFGGMYGMTAFSDTWVLTQRH